MLPASAIVLGTAQFGMRYGMNGILLDRAATDSILDAAWDVGIRAVDTARAYGDAEERIGDWMRRRRRRWEIATKIARHRGPRNQTARWITSQFDASRKSLGVDRVEILLAHNSRDFLEEDGRAAFESIRANCSAGRIGTSTYDVADTESALAAGANAVQIPANIADWRHQDLIRDFAEGTLMVRSLFLQGSLLLLPDALPSWLTPMRKFIGDIRALADATGLTQASFVLAAARDGLNIRQFVLGMDAPEHIADAVNALQQPRLPDDVIARVREAAKSLPLDTIDPRRWPKRM